MNYYDAQEIMRRHEQGQPVGYASVDEAKAFIQGRQSVLKQPPIQLTASVAPPMSAFCICGARYGMHRVGDFACMSQKWVPGNGEPQWLAVKFQRLTSSGTGCSEVKT